MAPTSDVPTTAINADEMSDSDPDLPRSPSRRIAGAAYPLGAAGDRAGQQLSSPRHASRFSVAFLVKNHATKKQPRPAGGMTRSVGHATGSLLWSEGTTTHRRLLRLEECQAVRRRRWGRVNTVVLW